MWFATIAGSQTRRGGDRLTDTLTSFAHAKEKKMKARPLPRFCSSRAYELRHRRPTNDAYQRLDESVGIKPWKRLVFPVKVIAIRAPTQQSFTPKRSKKEKDKERERERRKKKVRQSSCKSNCKSNCKVEKNQSNVYSVKVSRMGAIAFVRLFGYTRNIDRKKEKRSGGGGIKG